ncbi:hypothetical protein D3C78_1231130 [compost metagenome]
MLLPVVVNQLVHAHTGDLVDADQHGLAGLPAIGVMGDKIFRDLLQTAAAGDDVIVTLQLTLQALLNIDIINFQLFKLGSDLLV